MQWIVIAGLVIVGAHLAWDRFRPRVRRLWGNRGPGATPENPIAGLDWRGQVDRLESERCDCGDRLRHLGSGPRQVGGRTIQALLGKCRRCGRTTTLYFDDDRA